MVHLSPSSAYMKLLSTPPSPSPSSTNPSTESPSDLLQKSFLLRKHHLAIDAWGASDVHVSHIYQPLTDLLYSAIPQHYQHLYPHPVWKLPSRVTRLARNILVSEFMIQEWADLFKGKSEAELEELAKSWEFNECMRREGLNAYLEGDARGE
jgi:hypothetical protein